MDEVKRAMTRVYRCPYKGTLMCPRCHTVAWADDVEGIVIGCDLGPLRNAEDDMAICDLFVDLENPGVHDTIRKAGQFLRLIGTEAGDTSSVGSVDTFPSRGRLGKEAET